MDELYHWTTGPRSNHKYIKREWKNGHWVYYYNELYTTLGRKKEHEKRADDAAYESARYAVRQQHLRDRENAKDPDTRANIDYNYTDKNLFNKRVSELRDKFNDTADREDALKNYSKKDIENLEKRREHYNEVRQDRINYEKSARGVVDSIIAASGSRLADSMTKGSEIYNTGKDWLKYYWNRR